MITSRAAVVDAHGAPFTLRSIRVPEPGPGSVLVRIRAVGICHTDIAVAAGHRDLPTPIVLGHEGAGDVETVGEGVTGIHVGDRVALSFAHCGACRACTGGHPSACAELIARNFSGVDPHGRATLQAADGSALHGSFFGQSSFSEYAVVDSRAVVRIPGELPYELAAPLGCSIQTGAGAVWRVARVQPGDRVLVSGVGAVGQSAIMAARISGAASIIAVDVAPERLDVALAVGATDTIDASRMDVPTALARLLPDGADAAIDTSGRPSVIDASLTALRVGGTLALVASGRGADSLALSRLVGKTVTGVLEGDSVPATSIPQLAGLALDGRLPLERIVRTYPFESMGLALVDMHSGTAIKPVLLL
ncbi:NAD(P)-dependent alcohol dehydrogenase [Marisediminicola sp. LYQ85]|uniref:NAD(P)-dependent alcohol dehydrogenase n=1 Tax=Marisediminicola sp. LYQ85 TaxID=3391062 RepID=UPI0039830D93